MTKTKEIVKKEENKQVGFFSLEDDKMLDKMSADSVKYNDNTSGEDLAIPRVNLLQSGSPQVNKSGPDFIDGAEAGDLYNTLSKQIIKGEKGMLFVPAARDITYIEWKDRDSGGGMVNHFGNDSSEYAKAEIDDKGKRLSKEGHEIVKTYNVYGTIIDLENKKQSQVMMSLTHSKVKKMKVWNTMIRSLIDKKTGRQLPSYAGVYLITSVPETRNNKSWFNLNIEHYGYTLAIPEIGEKIYESSKPFSTLVSTSKIKIDKKREDFVDGEATDSDKV